ncbi:eukaryotic translation initiation factor 3 subunit a [Anaeramoeba flamelloides]|uniref:Eukaryotic translation initiation factor 3 subunit a n=1 Tax=Anaeramoeba flamelloides TaxID=1746091 RepID=A0AAV7YNU8_9EUKA|nr:eukaryotic translation initiation factor 3 subunit a [Anaeramoeba flamelloides]
MSDTAQSALVQANDYLVVGSTANALNVLRDFILIRASKTWELAYETLMIKFVDLCVLLKHTESVSKVFHQYRNICHQANIISLEKVIFHFLEIIEVKIKEEMVKQNITVEALERSKDREETYLLAQFGSGSLTHDQGSFGKINKRLADKEDLKQYQVWCQYIWKIYYYMLENIKFTQYLEDLYCKIAKDTFRYCREYKRIYETRQLSTILSQHLSKLENYQNQKQNIILTNQESLKKLLDLRFTQLETQFALKKWQDIYHTFGSINSLHNKYKAVLDPETEIKYFKKLSEFLWLTGFKKLHSFALRILYEKSRKTLEKSDNLELSSQLLLSSLVIPFEQQNEKSSGLSSRLWKEASETRKVSNLSEIFLGQKNDMIRKDHVNYLNRKNISNLVYPELKNLYQLIENNFDPLNLFTKAIPTFEFIESKPQLSRYLSSLKKQTLNKFFIEISQIYTTISFDYLIKLLPNITLKEIIQYLIEQSKNGKLNLVIDHKNKIVRFYTVDVQNINIRDQLSTLAHNLSSLIQLTEIEKNKSSKKTTQKQQQQQQQQTPNKEIDIEKEKETETETETSNEEYNPERFEHELKTENYLLQSRLDQIEERRLSKIKELEKIAKQKREKEIAEKEKIKRLEKLEKEKVEREKQKKEDRILYNKLLSICTVQEARQYDFEKMTRKEIEEAQKNIEEKREEEKLEKKKQEYIDKFCTIAKNRDYFERAARELEIEKIKTIVLKKDQISKVEYENKKKSIREEAKIKFDEQTKRKKLFVPYFDLSEQFKIKFLKKQQEIYDGRVTEERKKFDDRKIKIREEIKLKEEELKKIVELENKKQEERKKKREELERKKQQLREEKEKEKETKPKTDNRDKETKERSSSQSSSKSSSRGRKETEKERKERKERERRREKDRERRREKDRERRRERERSSKSSSKSSSRSRKETEKERKERKERERRREKDRERRREKERSSNSSSRSSSRYKSSSSSSSSKYKDYDREKDGRRDRERERERERESSHSGSRSSSRYNESERGNYKSSRDYNNYDRRRNDRYSSQTKNIDEDDNWRKKK